jgi:hypothetical protein
MLLALMAFSPRANVYAHVTGFGAGLLLGGLAPSQILRPASQGILALTSATMLGMAWWSALSSP